jgi:3-oxoacyl-[acyl-carrier-protein] synthase III
MSIAHIDYYIPVEELSIAKFIDQLNKDMIPQAFASPAEYFEFINESLGLESIRVENNLPPEDMISEVLEKAIRSNQLDPAKIDMIVFVPELHNAGRKNIAHYIQHKYGMKKAQVLHLTGNHCVNIEIAMSFCSDLLKANNYLNNILIISATRAKSLGDRVVGTYGIYGDAAGLILLSSGSSEIVVHDMVNICNGELYEADLEKEHVLKHCQYSIKCLNQLIERNSLKDNPIQDIIIHNANPLLVKQCLNSKGFPENLIFMHNLSKYGHLNQLDFLVNLKDLVTSKKEQTKRRVISFGSGWAGSYVSMLMSY